MWHLQGVGRFRHWASCCAGVTSTWCWLFPLSIGSCCAMLVHWCNPCKLRKMMQYDIIWLLSQMLCHLMRLNVSILGWSGMVVEALASLPCTANEAIRSAAESVAGGDRSNWAPWAVHLNIFELIPRWSSLRSEFWSRCISQWYEVYIYIYILFFSQLRSTSLNWWSFLSSSVTMKCDGGWTTGHWNRISTRRQMSGLSFTPIPHVFLHVFPANPKMYGFPSQVGDGRERFHFGGWTSSHLVGLRELLPSLAPTMARSLGEAEGTGLQCSWSLYPLESSWTWTRDVQLWGALWFGDFSEPLSRAGAGCALKTWAIYLCRMGSGRSALVVAETPGSCTFEVVGQRLPDGRAPLVEGALAETQALFGGSWRAYHRHASGEWVWLLGCRQELFGGVEDYFAWGVWQWLSLTIHQWWYILARPTAEWWLGWHAAHRQLWLRSCTATSRTACSAAPRALVQYGVLDRQHGVGLKMLRK